MTALRLAACAVSAAALLGPLPALAQEKACLMEGSFTFANETTEIKDCLQNNGVAPAQFKETCGTLAQATTAFGGPPAKISYLAACPPQPQGVCDGFFGQPMASYYYKRDPKTLASTKASCQAQGGRWR